MSNSLSGPWKEEAKGPRKLTSNVLGLAIFYSCTSKTVKQKQEDSFGTHTTGMRMRNPDRKSE